MTQRLDLFTVVALAALSLPQVGFAEQPLSQLPKDAVSVSFAWVALPQHMLEVTKDHGPLAGLSVGFLEGSSAAVGRVLSVIDRDAPPDRRDEPQAPAWLNLPRETLRQTSHREPALLRYTF